MNPRCSICGDARAGWVCGECRADPANDGWREGDEVLLSSVPDGAASVVWGRAAPRRPAKFYRVARAMVDDPAASFSEVARRCDVSRALVMKVYLELFELSDAERLALSRANEVERVGDGAVQAAAWREWKATRDISKRLSEDERAEARPPRRFVEVELGYGVGCGPSLSQTLARIARAREAIAQRDLLPCRSLSVASGVARAKRRREVER